MTALVIVLLALALVLALALALARRRNPRRALGGAAPTHIVVDLLNLTHALRTSAAAPLTTEEIVAAVDRTSACLHREYPGRVVYVVKDRDSRGDTGAAGAAYSAAAVRNQVYVCLVEKYAAAPAAPAAHSAKGRDDYYMAVLADRYRCPVMTEDRLKDFDEFRDNVAPFHVTEYAYWRAQPAREYVTPASQKLRRPRIVHLCVQ